MQSSQAARMRLKDLLHSILHYRPPEDAHKIVEEARRDARHSLWETAFRRERIRAAELIAKKREAESLRRTLKLSGSAEVQRRLRALEDEIAEMESTEMEARERLSNSQRETLMALEAAALRARNAAALEEVRRRGREIKRLEQEHELYRLEDR